jgi:hypothetical protein
MNENRNADDPLDEFSEADRAWMRGHLPELRKAAADPGIANVYLGIAFVVGLIAHVAGYLLKTSSPSEPLGLLAELLYAIGFALWTGVVVVLFVEVLPEAKRRQIQRAVDALDAAARAEGKTGTERKP